MNHTTRKLAHGLLLAAIAVLLFCCRAHAQGPVPNTWTITDPGAGGAFLAIGAGPDGRLIAGSDLSGAYTSTNHGESWSILASPLARNGRPASAAITSSHIPAVGFDPKDPNTFYVGSDIGLWRTNDGGQHFTQPSTIPATDYVTYVAFSASDVNIGYAATLPVFDSVKGKVYKTVDRGLTWTLVSSRGLASNARIQKLVIDPVKPNTVYLVTGVDIFVSSAAANLWKSTNGGNSWAKLNIGPGTIWDVATLPNASSPLYLTKGIPQIPHNSDGVYNSTNGGRTWTKIFDQPGRIFLKRENPQVIRLINSAGTFESLNGGQTWSQKGDETKWPCGWPSFCYSIDTNNVRALGEDLANSNAYYWANSQFVYGSFDGGATFTPLYTNEIPTRSGNWRGTGISNAETMAVSVSAANPNVIYLGFQDLGCWHSEDKGNTWRTCNEPAFTRSWNGLGGEVDTVLADSSRANVAWASLGDSNFALIYKTTNAGELGSWSAANSGMRTSATKSAISGLSLSYSSNSENRTLFVVQNSTSAGVSRSEVYKSTNDAATWSLAFSQPGASFGNTIHPLQATAVDHFSGSLIYAGGDKGVWRSLDGGVSWTQVGGSALAHTWDIQVDPLTSGIVYAVVWTTGGGLYRSADSGSTWSKVLTDDNLRGVAIHPLKSKIVVAGSSENFCCGASPFNSNGVQFSMDITNLAGNPWTPANEGLPWPFAANIAFDPLNPQWVIAATPGTAFHFRLFPNF